MKRKTFLKSAALLAGGLFQIPFSNEKYPAEAMDFAFAEPPGDGKLFDVILIGGSFAGISAALGLGRCMRSVLLIDEGSPRNRTSSQANNLFSRDGQAPAAIIQEARSQLEPYRQYLSKISGTVSDLRSENGVFSIQTNNGRRFESRMVVFASGVTDNLIDIKGIQELWGRSVFHCPYCHGWESRGKKAVVVGRGNSGLGVATTLSHWNPDITYYTQGMDLDLPASVITQLNGLGIKITHDTVLEIESADNGVHIRTSASAEKLHYETCYAPGNMVANSSLATSLGCEMRPNGSIVVDERYQSTVQNVYAIGDVSSRTNGQVIHAAFSGTVVAATINSTLLSRRLS